MSEAAYKLRRILEDTPQKLDGIPLKGIPSLFDRGDYKYDVLAAAFPVAGDTPTEQEMDYRQNLPPTFDQGHRGSCGFAAASWVLKAFQEISQGDFPARGLSVAMGYSVAKTLDGIPDQEGTYGRIVMKVLKEYGLCPEDMFDYDLLLNLPAPQVPKVPPEAIKAAAKYKIDTYASICALSDASRNSVISTMKQALAREGPFLIGHIVTENFYPGRDGKLPLPAGKIRGAHLAGIVGDRPRQHSFIYRTSWPQWGDRGDALLPYEWITTRFDYGWYLFEGWTAVDLVVPRAAKEIVFEKDSSIALVDGQEILLDEPATISGYNRMRVPVRAMAGNMGYLVAGWDGRRATLRRPN